ncbi:MAG TPA: thioredoxin domain-containing protein, partial [Nitrososphaerales archaeon]|nr:thioredoxin domain-containing protein [Nitrososphaerales archaeon]
MSGTKANRLATEKSPYLLEHAHDPVDWWPWGKEAKARAKNDGKPIFLSIGYSTCHWCHVLQSESFKDQKTASFINRNFIPIKVDREERPEVDAYYMTAVQAMTGGGGWPLSVFLTPDLKPFYGGTYFPPEPRYGMPSFMQVLDFVSKLWKDRREEVVSNTQQVLKALEEQTGGGEWELKKEALEEGYAELVSSFDTAHGGFGSAPKFPLPLSLGFLLRYQFRTGKELALRSVTETLDGMLSGGIRDHIGGGFHRYSTDRVWLVPHFEKMLYDNALLARVYLEGYQVTGRAEYAEVARETLGWVSTEMTSPEGGFYSAQDADTEQGEGHFYSWTPEEVVDVLGQADGSEFNLVFGVTSTGNFEGRSLLHMQPGGVAKDRQLGIARSKSALYKARSK